MRAAVGPGPSYRIGAGHAVIDRDNIHRWSMIAARQKLSLKGCGAARNCPRSQFNQPTFPPGNIDKAVHPRGKIRTDRNIGGKHVIVAQDFVGEPSRCAKPSAAPRCP